MVVHLHIAARPAQRIVGFKRQAFGLQRIAVAPLCLVEAHLERALQPLERQRRQPFAQGDIHRLQARLNAHAAAQPLAVFRLHVQAPPALAQSHILAQIHILAQLRHIQLGNVGQYRARPFAPTRGFVQQAVLPVGRSRNWPPPACRWRQGQLQLVMPAAVFQMRLHLRNGQRRNLALRIAPLNAAFANFQLRLRQQPVQRRIRPRIALLRLLGGLPLRQSHACHVNTPIRQPPGMQHRPQYGQARKPAPQQRPDRGLCLYRIHMQPFVARLVLKAHMAQLHNGLQAVLDGGNLAYLDL